MDLNIDSLDFSCCNVLIIGDVMIDRYISGDTERVSPESPVPVVHIQGEKNIAGGAANVALNVSSLGGCASIQGVVGNDSDGTLLSTLMQDKGVKPNFSTTDDAPTIVKTRVMSRHQQLLRLDYEQRPCEKSKQYLYECFVDILDQFTVVILSDYAKGAVEDAQQFISAAKSRNVPILVDPKGKDFSKYRGATLLTPNLAEFESIVGKCSSNEEIVSRARQLLADFDIEAVLVTRGADGMTLVQSGRREIHIPTEAADVFDVTGAGDTVIASFAACFSVTGNMVDSARFANMCAGIVVGKSGTATVSMEEIRRKISFDHSHAILTNEQSVLQEVFIAKNENKQIVFTNGCFDVLHAGHVKCLQRARELGDLLIVGINSDRSVKALKGDSRPINSLESRCEVLSSLRSVDYVVPFDTDTPEALIKLITPDVLVKGGDYAVENIAGADHVVKSGGQVKVIDFLEGFSSTLVIEALGK